jgi:2,3-dihydroxybenzoate decarboxylase
VSKLNQPKRRKPEAKYKKIAVEEHFSTVEHLDLLRAILEKTYPDPKVVEEERFIASDAPFLPISSTPPVREMLDSLLDIGEGRLQVMNQFGMDMQVLSLVSPGVQVFDATSGTRMATKFNNELSKVVNEHPTRFAGLASLALQNPNEAADELERSVKELGLKGACICTHTKGEYPDDKKYRVIFQRAHQLDAPIYLHPRGPSPGMIRPYLDYPFLDSAMLGFAAEAGLSAMRLICSGLFDEYPNLKMVLGHLGEAIPFWLSRIDNFWKRGPLSLTLKKTPSQYFKDNFFVTTSGMFSEPAFRCTLSILGADHILFAVDYPMESPQEATELLEGARMERSDKERIYHLNAEKVFSL